MTNMLSTKAGQTGANVVVVPPKLFLFTILAGLLGQLVWPLNLAQGFVLPWLGLSLISGSLGLMVWADGTFKQAETAVNPQHPATKLVTSGPYRFSRNPMYLAFILIQLGVGLAVSSWWPIITLLPASLILRWGIIAREEQHLARRFGADYLDYKTAVRRWL